jgi:hypothetical protein
MAFPTPVPALAACLLLAWTGQARAIDACAVPPRFGVEASAAAIVRTACQEHRAWLQPFIETDGRLAWLAITEAERSALDDVQQTPAWQRVASYWRESGTLAAMGQTPGAASCASVPGERVASNDCRAFVLDNPWSAAFISWVMRRAGLPGFLGSARHIDYIARAWRNPAASPYVYEDPFSGKPAPGDMLCFLREDVPRGQAAIRLRAALSGGTPLPTRSHCEIVIAANPGGDRTLHLVSGNVLNTVMMRKLPLDRTGRLLHRPLDSTGDSGSGDETSTQAPAWLPDGRGCDPGIPGACTFNGQDWAVLLKLKPQVELDRLRPLAADAQLAPAPVQAPPEAPAGEQD